MKDSFCNVNIIGFRTVTTSYFWIVLIILSSATKKFAHFFSKIKWKNNTQTFVVFKNCLVQKPEKKGQKKTEHRKTIFHLAKSTFFIFSCSNFRTCVWKEKSCTYSQLFAANADLKQVRQMKQTLKLLNKITKLTWSARKNRKKPSKTKNIADTMFQFCFVLCWCFFNVCWFILFLLFLIFFHNFVIASWTQWKH